MPFPDFARLRTRARTGALSLIAAGLRDRRAHVPYSYGWLNDLVGSLVRQETAAALRPAYTWGLVQGAALARALGVPAVSAIEFGVAGGNGLTALERIAARIEPDFGVQIELHGFDTGVGLPSVDDPRDLPNLYAPGDYAMDVERLRASLHRARLHLGPVRETIAPFLAAEPAPVAFVSFDVDLYTSTRDALTVFRANHTRLLPRVYCYLDDILGLTFGDHNGERLAVREFNDEHEQRKISPIYGLRHYLPWPLRDQQWTDMMFLLHLMDHPRYGDNDGLIGTASAPLL